MAKVQSLTPAAIDALRSGKISDKQTPGLTVEASGTKKVWRYRRLISGTTTILKRTLGAFPAHNIADARQWAAALNIAVERGEDPRPAEKAEKARDTLSMSAVHATYMERTATGATRLRGKGKPLKASTLAHKRKIWSCDVAPSMGAKSLYDVTEDDLWNLVDAKGETSLVRANRLSSEIKTFFAWCVSRDAKRFGVDMHASANPAITLLVKPFAEGTRKRYLSDDEIVLLFRALAKQNRQRQRAFLLMLLTGARFSEAMCARLSEFRAGVWTIPADRAKNGQEHAIALGPWGQTLFAVNSALLFPCVRDEKKPSTNGWHTIRYNIHKQMEELAGHEIEGWTYHDLRRTLRSNCFRLGIAFETREAMLNHAKEEMERRYDAYELEEEKIEGFAKWEAHLIGLARKARVADKLGVPTKEDASRTKPRLRRA